MKKACSGVGVGEREGGSDPVLDLDVVPALDRQVGEGEGCSPTLSVFTSASASASAASAASSSSSASASAVISAKAAAEAAGKKKALDAKKKGLKRL